VDPIPDPLLLTKLGSAGNRTRDLWIISQKLWKLYHRGIPVTGIGLLLLTALRTSNLIFSKLNYEIFLPHANKWRTYFYKALRGRNFFHSFTTCRVIFLRLLLGRNMVTLLQPADRDVACRFADCRHCRAQPTRPSVSRLTMASRHWYICVVSHWLQSNTDYNRVRT
jgi:hypothetical protein